MGAMMSPASNLYSANLPKKPPQGMPSYYGAPPSGQSPTFGQMQQQGQPRPAPPSGWYNYTPGSTQQRPPSTPGYSPPPASPPTGYRTPTTTPGYTPPPVPTQTGTQPRAPIAGSTPGYNPPPAPPQNATPQTPQTPSTTQYGSGPAATSQQQNTANQLGAATQNLLLNQLQNPDPLASQAFQTQMQQAQTQLNEQYKKQQDAINSSLASRGVYDSSLAGGYLSDLNTAQGRQMASIAANLLPQEAQLAQSGTNSAISNILGYNQNQYNQQYGTAQLNMQQQALQNQQLQALLGLSAT